MTNPGTRGRRLSHELRTPLNAILGNVELLLDGTTGPLSPDARACVGEIQAAGHQLLRQVQTLLLWSETTASKLALDGAPLDLIGLVRQIVAGEHQGPLQVQPNDASLMVRGDPAWLTTMMVKVVELGAAATPAITLRAREDHAALGFSWPGFCPDQVAPPQIALIGAIADLHGASVGLTSDGLCLYWPDGQSGQVDAPGAAGRRESPNGSAQDCAQGRD
jgi:hypothetical protein